MITKLIATILSSVSVFRHRQLHSTPSLLQRPSHPLYKRIDWALVKSGKYATVDPHDSSSILYLSPREYIINSRVALSNDVPLVVLATPQDEPIPHSDLESPPKTSPPKDLPSRLRSQDADFQTRRGRQARLRYLFTTPFLHLTQRVGEEEKGGKRKAPFTVFSGKHVESSSSRVGKGADPRDTTRPILQSTSSPTSGSSSSPSGSPDTLGYLDEVSKKRKDRKVATYESMIVVSRRNLVDIILKWSEITRFRIFGLAATEGQDKAIIDFAAHLLHIFEYNGIQMVIVRLKIYLHVVLAYCAGNKLTSTHRLGPRVSLRHGLPSALPASVRHAIRSKSVKAIRAWTSLLGMYKGLKGEWKGPDYGPIKRPQLTTDGNQCFADFSQYCTAIFVRLLPFYKAPGGQLFSLFPIPKAVLKTSETYVSTKGGPNGKSIVSAHWDLVAWLVRAGHELGYFDNRVIRIKPDVSFKGTFDDWLRSKEHPFKEFIFWCTLNLDPILSKLPWAKLMLHLGDVRLKHAVTNLLFKLETLDLVQIASKPGNPITSANDIRVDPWDHTPEDLEPKWCKKSTSGGLNVAKFVSLYEAAGKVRNIVMFDWLSQQCLLPIHDMLFNFIRKFPSDATFDQEGAVKSFSQREHTYIASYDLKAATETISINLYRILFEPIFGKQIVDLWMDVLVDRDVALADDAPVFREGYHLRYTRGQPMGALSSWGAMAILHHAIVQFCAFSVMANGIEAKFEWFKDYLVLGDDIVIANQQVADKYLEVCEALGISIGLPKSFVSNEAFFNFAGQSFLAQQNISPISFKEELSCRSPGTRLEMALRLCNRGLIDFTSNGWLAPLLRAVLPKPAYKRVMEYLLLGKGVHYAVRAVLVATFAQLDKFPVSDFSEDHPLSAKQGLSVYGYARLFKVGATLFSEPLVKCLLRKPGDDEADLNEIVLGLVVCKAKSLYARFLKVNPILRHWKANASRSPDGRILNPHIFFPDMLSHVAPLLWPYPTFGKKMDELLEWEASYRRPVKTIIVAYSLQPITIDLLEHTCEMTIPQMWSMLLEAEKALPLKPDTILGKSTDVPTPSPDDIYRQAEVRFMQWATHMELGAAARLEPAFSLRSSPEIMDEGFSLNPQFPKDN